MQNIINGGLYSVNFDGQTAAEFNGEHPTLIVRTLKENDMYIAVPLTSYTKERWIKCKTKGFGTRVKSSNSIARIDKFKIINKNAIKNRWKDNNKILKIELDELKDINNKLDLYIKLSSDKGLKEYKKYIEQYKQIYTSLQELIKNDTSDLFSKEIKDNYLILKTSKSNVNQLSKAGIKEIISDIYHCENPIIELVNSEIFIKIPKCY